MAENGYKSYMRLKIKGVTKADYGTFGCTAKNSFGESNGTIKVYGKESRFSPDEGIKMGFSTEIPKELLINSPEPTTPPSYPNRTSPNEKKTDDSYSSRRSKYISKKVLRLYLNVIFSPADGIDGRSREHKKDQHMGKYQTRDFEHHSDDEISSTVSPDGVLNFDVNKLYKNRGKTFCSNPSILVLIPPSSSTPSSGKKRGMHRERDFMKVDIHYSSSETLHLSYVYSLITILCLFFIVL